MGAFTEVKTIIETLIWRKDLPSTDRHNVVRHIMGNDVCAGAQGHRVLRSLVFRRPHSVSRTYKQIDKLKTVTMAFLYLLIMLDFIFVFRCLLSIDSRYSLSSLTSQTL